MNIAKNPYFFKFLLVTLLIFLTSGIYSQKYILLKTYNIDSLRAILPDQTGEERVNSLNHLAVSLSFIDYNQSLYYADEAMNLAKELDYEKGMANAFRNYGHIYQYQGNYPEALYNYHEALQLNKKLNRKFEEGWVCYDIAETHYFANNYEKTIEYGHIALDIFNERKNEGTTVGGAREFVTTYGGLAETYFYLGMHDKSLEMDLIALEIMERNGLGNIEMILKYWTIGDSYENMDNDDSAKVYFLKSLAYPDESLNMRTLKYRNNINLGRLYYNAGEIDSAIYYLESAFEFYDKHGFLYWALMTSGGLGNIYFRNNRINSAEKYLLKAENIFNEIVEKNSWYRHDSLKYIASYGLELYHPLPPVRLKEMSWGGSMYMYKLLYYLNTSLNRTSEALKYHVKYSDAKDTLNKLQRNRETIELQTRYESERKDQQIATLSLENELKESRLQQNRYFLFGTAGLFVLIMMFGYILFRQNKLRADQRVLVLQQKLFRSQMNPHFIFNSLASIQNFIVKQDSRKASIFLSRFSELVRSILENSAQEFVTYEKEINTIKNYLELQKVRYIDKFNYSIEIDEAIDTESMRIPPMLAQPIIENSIEHGIKQKETSGTVQVRFKRLNGTVLFEVEDDGIGRKRAMEIMLRQDKDHKSLATAIIHERIRVLNRKLKKKITMVVNDLTDSNHEPLGTLVTFEIPVLFG